MLLRPTRTALRVDPQVQSAFDALNRGDLAIARRAYEAALANDPNSSDAMHGLASVARREDRPELAEHWLRKALNVNPKDGAALAGLLELFAMHQPGAAEQRLRALTTEHPALPEAHVALANLYTRNQRWHEAQQAWFAAYTLQPENADVLFNLAVSLEHLNQPRLARQYYGEALKATRFGPARFNPADAAARVRDLTEQ
jgi:Tfp pilus assembly protein PilF